MFCKQCGNPTTNNSDLCPNCANNQTVPNNSQPKKSKTKTLLCILIPVLAVILLTIAFFAIKGIGGSSIAGRSGADGSDSGLNLFGNDISSGKNYYGYNAVIDNEHGEFYIGGAAPSEINQTGEFSGLTVTYADENKEMPLQWLDIYKNAYDGKSLYGRIADNYTLYKTTFDSSSHATAEIWVDESLLSDYNLRSNCMYYFQAEDDYVYFIYSPSPEYFVAETENAYRLGRISKDGKEIFLYDEIASSYAIQDGWIYFYNNGYTYDHNSKSYTATEENIGIYKMTVDGNRKTALKTDFAEIYQPSGSSILCCDKLSIYGNYLYYLDYTDSGQSRIYRMDLDGRHTEVISANGASRYTVDVDNDVVYYSTGERNTYSSTTRKLYKINLSFGEETEIMEMKYIDDSDFSLYNNNLYFTGNSSTMMYFAIAGARYDIANDNLQYLYGKENDDESGYSFYWEDSSVDSFN